MSATFLRSSLRVWTRRIKRRKRQLERIEKRAHRKGKHASPQVSVHEQHRIEQAKRRLAQAHRMRKRRQRQLRNRPLHERAAEFAHTLVGIMEQGGNNIGPRVSAIIVANGGTPGEAWCGDFCAFVYRHVGSKAVTRWWASVAMLSSVAGVSRTIHPVEGDLVRYTFDHVGIFLKDNGNGTITTIEGNTGDTGAVSDSATGGDGVYMKVRSKSLVRDYLHVTK